MGGRPGKQEQVPNFHDNLRDEICYDVIEPGSLVCDCAKHTSGSAGQNGGILMETAAGREGSWAAVTVKKEKFESWP